MVGASSGHRRRLPNGKTRSAAEQADEPDLDKWVFSATAPSVGEVSLSHGSGQAGYPPGR